MEIWLEKDALSGVIYPITSMFDVPLMVARSKHRQLRSVADRQLPVNIVQMDFDSALAQIQLPTDMFVA